jgi:hypothetical protein
MLRLRDTASFMAVSFIAMCIAILIVGATPLWARSDGVPNLHVDQLCHGIASQQADPMAENYPAVSFDRCMQAEREDREELQKQWAGYNAEEKRHCIAEASAGGSASYTELLTCLEMAHVVKELRQSSPNGEYKSPVSR